MNSVIRNKPNFEGEYFVYGQPQWLDTAYRAASLLSGIALAWFATTLTSQIGILTQVLFLISVVLILTALSPRSEWSAVYFICDQNGLYFPSGKAQFMFARDKDTPWLFVPWANISDIRNQMVLDEAANKQGFALAIIATADERREFLSRLTISRHLIAKRSLPKNTCQIGFASFFHDPDDVVKLLNRYRASNTVEAA
jgi:hypothetical protein